jgi:hypothetical protein
MTSSHVSMTFHDIIDKVMTFDDVYGTDGTVENRRAAVPFFDGTDRNRRNRSVPATTGGMSASVQTAESQVLLSRRAQSEDDSSSCPDAFYDRQVRRQLI